MRASGRRPASPLVGQAERVPRSRRAGRGTDGPSRTKVAPRPAAARDPRGCGAHPARRGSMRRAGRPVKLQPKPHARRPPPPGNTAVRASGRGRITPVYRAAIPAPAEATVRPCRRAPRIRSRRRPTPRVARGAAPIAARRSAGRVEELRRAISRPDVALAGAVAASRSCATAAGRRPPGRGGLGTPGERRGGAPAPPRSPRRRGHDREGHPRAERDQQTVVRSRGPRRAAVDHVAAQAHSRGATPNSAELSGEVAAEDRTRRRIARSRGPRDPRRRPPADRRRSRRAPHARRRLVPPGDEPMRSASRTAPSTRAIASWKRPTVPIEVPFVTRRSTIIGTSASRSAPTRAPSASAIAASSSFRLRVVAGERRRRGGSRRPSGHVAGTPRGRRMSARTPRPAPDAVRARPSPATAPAAAARSPARAPGLPGRAEVHDRRPRAARTVGDAPARARRIACGWRSSGSSSSSSSRCASACPGAPSAYARSAAARSETRACAASAWPSGPSGTAR